MSVRPIDIQSLLIRAEDIQKIHQTQHQHPQQQQVHAYIQFQQQEEVKRKQSPPSPRPEDAKIREEANYSRKRQYAPSKEKKKGISPQKFSSEKKSNIVDIQI